jgi:signal transduction histidine kinase
MTDRVEPLSGSLNVTSETGKRTTVSGTSPLKVSEPVP